MMTKVFLSYARGDDETFVRRLHGNLTAAGFDVWFDRISMPSRELTFYQEIRDAIADRERLVLVVGPAAVASDYVTQEWRFAYFEGGKCVNPIVRLNGRNADGSPIDGYELIPEDLKLLHAEDFRDDAHYPEHLVNLIRQLSGPAPPVGKLVAVPELPAHFVAQPDRIRALRDILLADLTKPVVVSGAAGRVGLQGMGGIGKSVLASALAHHPEVRRGFPDGVYWVTLGQQPAILELQKQLLHELGDDSIFTGSEPGKQKLRDALSGRAALLILDDVWERSHAEAFNVVGARCRLLLTTRDVGLVTALAANENHYQVQLPATAEAEVMLAAAAGLSGKLPSEARAIIEECGRLPLALALCGGMMASGVSGAHLLEALREHDLEYLSTNAPAEDQHQNVWKAMDISVRAVPEDQRARFAELAVFASGAGAPETAVATLWQHTGSLSPRHTNKLLAELAARSLVEYTPAKPGESGGHLRLHDLLHLFGLGMAEKQFGSLAALHQRLLDAYETKCSGTGADKWPTGPNDGYFFEHLCEHLIAGDKLDQAIGLLTDAPWLQTKCNDDLAFSLQSDYELLSVATKGASMVSQNLRRAADLILGALQLSMHLVARDARQFAGQMTARMLIYKDNPSIAPLLDRLDQGASRPWLRPFHPSLQPPGGPVIRTLAGHADSVHGVAVTPDGKRAVSASMDKTLKVWDLETGRVLNTLEGHSGGVLGVAVTPDGKRAVSASTDKTLKVWDLETGRVLNTLEGHSGGVLGVAVTPDGKRAVSAASCDNTLKIWDLETGCVLDTLEGHVYSVAGVAVTADGKRAVSASWDSTLKVWDVETGRELRTLRAYPGSVADVAVTLDGKRAVSASDGVDSASTLKVWNLETGSTLATLEGHSDGVLGVAVSPDGKRAVSASRDRTLRVWDLETDCAVRTLKGHSDGVVHVAITPDGKRAVSASMDKTLRVWDLETDCAVRTLKGHSDRVAGVAVIPDSKRAVSASWDSTLKVWDVETGSTLATLEGHSGEVAGVAVTPDGKRAVSASGDYSLKVWALETSRVLHTLEGHTSVVAGVAVTPDGKRAVSASWDSTLKVWDLETGRVLNTLEDHLSEFRGVVVTPDGERAVSASWDSTLKVWDLETGCAVRTLGGNFRLIYGVAADDIRRRTVAAPRDKSLTVWDQETGSTLAILEGHSGGIIGVAVTLDSKRAVSASWDSTLKVWDLETGRVLNTLEGHSSEVRGVAVTPDGKRAVSASSDKTLKIWDLETGTEIATFTCDVAANCCTIIDAHRIVAGDILGQLHWLELVE
jgi:WD40 repeat protein